MVGASAISGVVIIANAVAAIAAAAITAAGDGGIAFTTDTILTLDGIKILNNALLQWKDDCNQRALAKVMPQCIHGVENITPSQQKFTAMELSICEFENNGLDYPLECHASVRNLNTNTCIQALEKSPQYWTTFSGNYRAVKDICHQISLPYEKDQIIEVYENMTLLYRSVMEDLKSSHHKYTVELEMKIQNKFNKLFSVVDDLMRSRAEENNKVNQTFNKFYENFQVSISNALVVMQNSYDGANTNFELMQRHVSYFATELQRILLLVQQQGEKLQMQQEQLVTGNVKLSIQQDKLFDNMQLFGNELDKLHNAEVSRVSSVNKQLQLTEFSIRHANSILRENTDELHLQRMLIAEYTPIILGNITNLLMHFLNQSASEIVGNFEHSLNLSLEKLNSKIDETANSLAVVNATIARCSIFASSVVETLGNLKNNTIRMMMMSMSMITPSVTFDGLISGAKTIVVFFTLVTRLVAVVAICLLIFLIWPIMKSFFFQPFCYLIKRCSYIVVSILVGVAAANFSVWLLQK